MAPEETASFTPGQLLAGRYRIVAALGKGGMGVVYRADDLILGQSVALKFLPPELARDPNRVARLRGEVRMARQVSHPNVCRVYDLGEVDGRSFLTMEYIDGQDLAGLLRQAGRLPGDRGVELARQVCLGLAAAHERGVIHRDLKPHNVMIDGRGQVRLTDFGLATFAEQVSPHEVRAGTPAYMAPEQLAGKEVTAQSDLFALGLVLYELFTGRRAFPARSPEEVRRLHEKATPSKPSSHVTDLDPAVERVILRCLEKDPRDRPRSAYEVLAGLPGGDPLAAALAAGETPSPQLVADAPVEGNLPPVVGLALLAATLAGIALVAHWNNQVRLFRQVPLQEGPEVLAHQARMIVQQLGHGEPPPADTVYGFGDNLAALEYLRKRDETPARWEALGSGQPAVLFFWFRQSSVHLTQRLSPAGPWFNMAPGRVTPSEPPADVPGMVTVQLDLKGRLIELLAVPPLEIPEQGAQVPNWQPAFRAAGLEMGAFTKAKPRLRPPVYASVQEAWIGKYPDRPEIPLRVEAASYLGKVVFFRVEPDDLAAVLGSAAERGAAGNTGYPILVAALLATGLTAGAWLAWRNWRQNRANRVGAWRLAVYVFVVSLLLWAVLAHHTWSFFGELFGLFAQALGRALVYAGILWLIYVALEPHVRRRWPWRIVAWNRVLDGRFRDPLVGRDLLIGGFGGVLGALALQLPYLTTAWLGQDPGPPLPALSQNLTNGWITLFGGLTQVIPAAFDLFFLLILILILRREWLAGLVYLVLMVATTVGHPEFPPASWVISPLYFSLGLVLLFRFGLLAYTVRLFFEAVLTTVPLTTDMSAWYAGTGLLYALLLLALVGYGFWASLGNRPLFPWRLLGEE